MIADIENKLLCWKCIGDEYLKGKVRSEGVANTCSYCECRGRTFRIADISGIVDVAFQQHYQQSRMEMNGYEWQAHKDPDSSFEFIPDGEPIEQAIENAADIPGKAATDIQAVLADRYSSWSSIEIGEQTEYDADLYYEEISPDDSKWQEKWRTFERALKTESRFFNPAAIDLLLELFDGVERLQTYTGSGLVVTAGPGTELTHLFRARAFQSPSKLEAAIGRPDTELGPPPSLFASSGRMNARGISVFYGADDPAAAVAEVRPPVGCHVAVGRFEITRELRLLDLSSFPSATLRGSIFNPEYAGELSRIRFLKGLAMRMARPVMPDDQEFEYLPTQAVADFLATGLVAPMDGIIFPSVQVAGEIKNVVLFHHASAVEVWQVPENVEIEVQMTSEDEDGSYPDFTAFWWRKANAEERAVSAEDAEIADYWEVFERTAREMTQQRRSTSLKIEPGEVEVRKIEAVEFKSTDYKVQHTEMSASTNAF
ncbi:RES family NAD+ phosphorylase [Rhizobium sp. FY34]|uniref:RES family NAD+ phosphorylase n=1 Tax=Rhizobium sp. FY34 TaxID=2562309 RepID=UPI0010C1072E|nr:RES family NAD+ phosphorylase [Rhizobium sp. FY34]